MAMAAILVKEPQPFLQSFVPQPKEASYDIRAKLAQQLQRRSFMKMLTDRWTDGRLDRRRTKSDHNPSGELQRRKQRIYQMMLMSYLFYFSISFFYFIFFFFNKKAYVVGNHLNCIDKSMQFKWVPTTYAFIKK